jgi:UTP--glucose-1-phosphate uridylyltransferase
MKKVTKAVFPVAGLGTRFLPATKANPKEMLPIVDKPLIQYAVEEAVAAGITDLIFITGRNKRSISDHFDMAYELENELERNGKTELLKIVQNIVPKNVNCIYIRQTQALGLGHAVRLAKPVVNDDAFAVILADDLLDGKTPIMKQMVEAYDYYRCSLLGVENVPADQTKSYGIVATTPLNKNIEQVSAIVEKPDPKDAPSTLAVVGRYILTHRIFHHLDSVQAGAGGEIQLTDGISALLTEEQILAYRFDGVRYDCGSKFGYLEATIRLGLKHPEVSRDLRALLESIVNDKKKAS